MTKYSAGINFDSDQECEQCHVSLGWVWLRVWGFLSRLSRYSGVPNKRAAHLFDFEWFFPHTHSY